MRSAPEGTAQHRAVRSHQGQQQVAEAADDIGAVAVVVKELVLAHCISFIDNRLGKDKVAKGNDIAGDGHGDGLDKGRKGREPQPKDGVVLNELGNAGEIDEAEVKGGQRHGLGRISNDACTNQTREHPKLGDELQPLVCMDPVEEIGGEHGNECDGHTAKDRDFYALHPRPRHTHDRGHAGTQDDADAQGAGDDTHDLFAQARDAKDEENQRHQKAQGNGGVDAPRARGKICHAPSPIRGGPGDPPG